MTTNDNIHLTRHPNVKTLSASKNKSTFIVVMSIIVVPLLPILKKCSEKTQQIIMFFKITIKRILIV